MIYHILFKSLRQYSFRYFKNLRYINLANAVTIIENIAFDD